MPFYLHSWNFVVGLPLFVSLFYVYEYLAEPWVPCGGRKRALALLEFRAVVSHAVGTGNQPSLCSDILLCVLTSADTRHIHICMELSRSAFRKPFSSVMGSGYQNSAC